MKTDLRFPVTIYIFLLLAGMAGAGLVMISTSNFGPGLTHDSTAYIFAAKSLREGKGFEYFGYPSPFIQWPPLYPILLAAANLLGIGYLEASSAINAIAHGLIILVSGYWFYARFRYKPYAVSGTMLLVFSLPLIQVSKYVWTETLFILFYILFYIFFEKYIRNKGFAHLIAAGAFSALACIDRYAGVTVVFAAAIFLLIRRESLKKKFLDILIYGSVSCLPLAIWVIRNYIVSSTLLGVRLPSTYGLKLNIQRTLTSMYTWIAPQLIPAGRMSAGILTALMTFTVLVFIIVMIIFLLVLCYRLIERLIHWKRTEAGVDLNHRDEFIANAYPVLFMGAFAMIYLAYLLASATKVLFEPINSRYLVPVYIPLVIAVIYGLDFLTGKFVHAPKSYFRTCLFIISGILVIYPAVNTVSAVAGDAVKGAGGYSSRVLYDNGLVAYVRENPRNVTYYSNSADMVSVLSGVRTYYLPKKEGPDMYGLEQFKNAVDRDQASVLIWFKSGVSPSVYGVKDIGRMFGLEVIKEFEKGTVYRILKQEAPANE